MGNTISSLIFAGTNTEKGLNGDNLRYFTAMAQAKNATEGAIAALTNSAQAAEGGLKVCPNSIVDKVGKSLSYIDDLAKEKSVMGGFSRTLQFVQKNINPTIVALSAYKVATAKDKEHELWKQGSGLAGMFASEGLFKMAQNTGVGKSIFASIAKAGGGGAKGKLLAAIVEGVGFAVASIGGWKVASKAGDALYEKTKNINLVA